MLAAPDHYGRNSPAAQTAHQSQSAVMSAKYNNAAWSSLRADVRRPPPRIRKCACYCDGHGLCAMPRVSLQAAKSTPATNRMSGPNDQAAGAPTKCSPGTEDSKLWFSEGYPLTVLICRNNGLRNLYFAISTEYPVASRTWSAICLLPSPDRKSTRLNSSHITISYAVFCLKKKKKKKKH